MQLFRPVGSMGLGRSKDIARVLLSRLAEDFRSVSVWFCRPVFEAGRSVEGRKVVAIN